MGPLSRDLQGPPYDALPATALELATRLTYLAAHGVGDWFQCTDGTTTGDGCNAFDRHGIACPVPAVQDSGCAGTPTVRPVVQVTPLNRSARLSWAAVPDALSYEVFRTEGVAQCAFGKTKVAEVEGTDFFDTGLANGREYSYVVIPKGPGLSCFGPNGWAGTADTWATSGFSATALEAATVAGEPVRLEVLYGMTRLNEKRGFAFDEVTFTDFELQVPDAQGNQLCPGPIFTDGFESGDTSAWSGDLP